MINIKFEFSLWIFIVSSTVHRNLFTNNFWEGGYIFILFYFSTLTLFSDLILDWRLDATLKELTSLVKEVNPEARRKGTFFDFAIVYPDPRAPVYRLREIGTTCAGHKGQDDGVSLANKKFVIGDFLDIAITPPRNERPNQRRNRPPYWSSHWSHGHHLSLVSDRGVYFLSHHFMCNCQHRFEEKK